MKYSVFLLLCLYYLFQVHSRQIVNPNNYFDYTIEFIKEDLDTRIGLTYYDVLILKVHININAQLVETSINDEIERLQAKKDEKCRNQLTELKNKARQNCQMEEDFKLLEVTRNKFRILTEVACQTMEICEEFNPFNSQTKALEECELSKIADLRQQSFIISEEFERMKKQLFEDHDRCIRTTLSTTFTEMAIVAYGEKCQYLQ